MKIKTDLIILILCLLFAGILSIFLGQDTSWDMANYHVYCPHALLNNRIGFDINPAGIQTYYNPFLDFPYYYMTKYLNDYPRLINFLQAQYYGLSIFLVYKISSILFIKKGIEKAFLILFSVLIGATGMVGILEIGTAFNDIQVAVFVLTSVYLLLKYLFTEDSKKRSLIIFVSGLLLGIGTGFKLTGAIFAISMFLTLCCLYKKYNSPVKILFYYFSGVVLGFLLIDGYWLYLNFVKFGNPLFPYYNNIFKSPYVLLQNYTDKRYFPENLMQWIFFPFYWHNNAIKINFVFEEQFRDFRYAAVYISVLIIAFSNFIFNFKKSFNKNFLKEYFKENNVSFIILFVFFSYITWLCQFSIIRYFVPIEFISGIIILIAIIYLKSILKSSRMYIGLWVFTVIFLLSTTVHCFSYRKAFDDKFFEFEDLKLPDNATVLILGGYPSSIWIPYQNPKARFIGLSGNGAYSFVQSEYTKNRIKNLIKKNRHNIYLLYSDFKPAPLNMDMVNEYVDMNEFSCRPVYNNLDKKYTFCQ